MSVFIDDFAFERPLDCSLEIAKSRRKSHGVSRVVGALVGAHGGGGELQAECATAALRWHHR